jgi:hypothetical protein
MTRVLRVSSIATRMFHVDQSRRPNYPMRWMPRRLTCSPASTESGSLPNPTDTYTPPLQSAPTAAGKPGVYSFFLIARTGLYRVDAHGEATADVEGLAGDEAGSIIEEEPGSMGDIFRRAESAHGD